ncbi:MAG: DUF3078 domain-containing protein [Bacteroidales bacterium]|nr:DUF3078 domain-containing protein [Bacteroidales bacterium]
MKKKLFLIIGLMAATLAVQAQNTQEAAAEAAAALSAADDVPEAPKNPRYWNTTLLTNINFGQTYLSQWAAGGYNNVSLAGAIDLTNKFEKGKLLGVNHLQLDYGFLYSADKPILQKNKDRIYFDAKWGYKTPVKNIAYSFSFNFLTQFDNNYAYGTPKSDGTDEPTVQDWLNARSLKSGFFAPAYINLGIGALWTPAPWFTLNVAPLSGGAVIVGIPELRKTYGMDLRSAGLDASVGTNYRPVRMEFGAKINAEMSWVINDVFSYKTEASLFYNYLTPKIEPRITWDNKIMWRLLKFFSLTLSTNLIYDPLVIVRDSNKDGVADTKGVQFKEYLEFGFSYTIAHNH